MSKSRDTTGFGEKPQALYETCQEEILDNGANASPHYLGHRTRLRERFRKGGAKALTNYEILELVLFRLLPRRDTKPIAKALLKHFGSLDALFSASESRLMTIKGIGPNTATDIKIIFELAKMLGKEEILDKPVLSNWYSVLKYCRLTMAFEEREQVRIIFLDKKDTLISEEVMHKGTIDHTPIYPREIVKRALDLSASSIIIVHNHPSGDPTPSHADIEMTKQIVKATNSLNIRLYDHIIIGKNSHASFRGLNLIR